MQNPFAHESYKQWTSYLQTIGASASSVVKLSDGQFVSVGNPGDAIEGFKEKQREQRRRSKAWVIDNEQFVRMKKPLGSFHTIQKKSSFLFLVWNRL